MTEKAPTFEEVVKYAVESGLYGKLPLQKFYDYYNKSGFEYRGSLMDWQGKMQEWADRQTAPVLETGAERAAKPKAGINVAQLEYIRKVFALA